MADNSQHSEMRMILVALQSNRTIHLLLHQYRKGVVNEGINSCARWSWNGIISNSHLTLLLFGLVSCRLSVQSRSSCVRLSVCLELSAVFGEGQEAVWRRGGREVDLGSCKNCSDFAWAFVSFLCIHCCVAGGRWRFFKGKSDAGAMNWWNLCSRVFWSDCSSWLTDTGVHARCV